VSLEIGIIAGHEPTSPHSLSKVSADINHVAFEWQEPTDNGGTPILEYLVLWDQGLGGALTQVDSTSASEKSWSSVGVVSDAEIVDG
jgi:hypothetical protein